MKKDKKAKPRAFVRAGVVVVQCVMCKTKKRIPIGTKMDGVPICDADYMPMATIGAEIGSRKVTVHEG